jgi:hypothetical protein
VSLCLDRILFVCSLRAVGSVTQQKRVRTCWLFFPAPFSASLFITIIAFSHYDPSIGLFNLRFNREVAIQKMIEASQRMIDVNSQVEGEAREEEWELIQL